MARQSTTEIRPAAVAAVLAKRGRWVSARRKIDGRPFFFIPGCTPGAVYMTSTDNCTCPFQQHHSGPCKHVLAVRQAAQPAPAPRRFTRGYHELFGPDED